MNKNLLVMTFVVCGLAFSALGCGDRPGNQAGYDQRDLPGVPANACSEELITTYNQLAQELHGFVDSHGTVGDILAIRDHAKALKTKYDGVVCSAVDAKTGDKMSINVNEKMGGLIDAIDKAIADAQNNPTPPADRLNDVFEVDFSALELPSVQLFQ